MSAQEETLETMYREATADYAAGDGALAVKWAFKHARARGKQLLAERELRLLEQQELHVRSRAVMLYDPGHELVLANLPSPVLVGRVQGDLARAVEEAQAAETIMVLLSKMPRAQRPAQQARPQQHRPVATNGARR